MDTIQALKSTDNPMIVEHLIAVFYQTYPNMKFLIDAGANKGFHFSRMNQLPNLNFCVAVEANPDHEETNLLKIKLSFLLIQFLPPNKVESV